MRANLHHQRNFYRYFYRAGTFEILSRLRNCVGSRFAHRIARAISRIYTTTHPEVLEVVRNNISLLQTKPATRASAVRVFENFSGVLTDYFGLRHQSSAHAAEMCPDRHGVEILQEISKTGKGGILATAHFGFFELGSALLTELGIPFTTLTLPESTSAMTAWRAKFRAHWGAPSLVIDEPFVSLEIVRSIREGRFVTMLIDRPLDEPSLPINTPGGRVPFSLAAALLAQSANCPIIPVAIWKTGQVYRMYTHEAIWVAPPEANAASRQLALEEATRKVAESLLQNMTQALEQWYQFIPVRS